MSSSNPPTRTAEPTPSLIREGCFLCRLRYQITTTQTPPRLIPEPTTPANAPHSAPKFHRPHAKVIQLRQQTDSPLPQNLRPSNRPCAERTPSSPPLNRQSCRHPTARRLKKSPAFLLLRPPILLPNDKLVVTNPPTIPHSSPRTLLSLLTPISPPYPPQTLPRRPEPPQIGVSPNPNSLNPNRRSSY